MEFTEFIRKPFVVEAIEITEENIHDVAPMVGTVYTKPDGTHFIQVNRRLVPNVFRAYPGFWVTRLGENIRCYSRKAFFSQFTEADPGMLEVVAFVEKRAK